MDKIEENKMTYNFLCDVLEKGGWTKKTIFINEKMIDVVSLNSAKHGETTLVIDIKCPENQKILIRGTEDGNIKKFKDAYTIRLTLTDSFKNEISQFTKIKITKEGTVTKGMIGDTFSPIRCFYADISKNDEDHLYRPRKNILLQEGEHLFTYVIGENIGPILPDVAIDRYHISFSIKADIFKL